MTALTDVLALAAPAVFGHNARARELVAALAVQSGCSETWEIEAAALLAQLGAVTLPAQTAEKLYSGAPLTATERTMIARVPAATRRILARIPGLDGVLQVLSHQHRRFDSIETDGMLPVGARMLRIGSDYIALERENPCPRTALERMRARAGAYDPHLLEVFARTVGSSTVVSESRRATRAGA